MAARRSSRSKAAATRSSKPARVTEADVKAALDVLRQDYWQDIRGTGDDIIRQVKDGDITTREEFEERLQQDIDGSSRVIYTLENQLTLVCSDNADAFVDEFGEEGLVKDGGVNWPAMAYATFMADVRGYIDANDDDDLFSNLRD